MTGQLDAVQIDALRRADAVRCAELEALLFPGDDPWPATAFRQAMALSYNHYVAARLGAVLVGYAGISRLGRHAPFEFEVHTIGVDPGYQGCGIGRRLLDDLLRFAAGDPVFLEVRTDNTAAIALYESAGFVRIGLRKNYYPGSGADAFTMRLEPEGPS